MDLETYVNSFFSEELERVANSKRMVVLPELSIYEKTILYVYTDIQKKEHQSLNALLWETMGSEMTDFGVYLESCLEKLDTHKGMVFRGAKTEYCDVKRYEQAQRDKSILTEYGFLSASKFPTIAQGFGQILFRIYAKTAKDIESLSKFEREKEVLFPRNSQFKVKYISFDGFFTSITLKEV